MTTNDTECGDFFPDISSTLGDRTTEERLTALDTLVAQATAGRQQLERALAEQQTLLRTVIDNLPDFIHFKDVASRFILDNIAHARTVGHTPTEMVGKTDFDVFPRARAAAFYADEQAIIQSGQPMIEREEQSLGADMQPIWALTTKVPVRGPDGQIVGIVGITRDITKYKQATEALEAAHENLERQVAARTAELEHANNDLREQFARREQAEKKLAEERNLLRTLIDLLPGAIFIKDRQSRIVINNVTHAAILGAASPEDCVGKSDFAFFVPEMAQIFYDDEQAVMQSGETVLNREQAALDHRTGNVIWQETTKLPLRNSAGQIVGIVGISQDVTERKQAAEALEHERSLLRTLIDILPDYIFVKDTAGRFELSNLAHAQAARQPRPEALTGKTSFDFFPQEQAASFHADDVAVIQSGQPLINAQRQTVDQYGHDRQVLTTKVPLRDQKQRIIGLVGISRDITQLVETQLELRRYQDQLEHLVEERTARLREANQTLQQEIVARTLTQQALRSSEERLRQITDNMLDMIWQTNAEETVEYASPSCLNSLGYAPDVLQGQSVYARIHPDHVGQVMEAVHSSGRVECLYQHADGHYLWLEILSSLVRDAAGSVVSVIFASRDITERKRVERELQDLNRMKTEFLSTAAHELRTPLTTIQGFSEVLLTREMAMDRMKHYLQMINEHSVQLHRIIDALLDISRLESKRGLTLDVQPVNLAELVEQIVVPFIESSPQHRFQCEGLLTCPVIQGDSFRLGQVLQNLLVNAVKYSPRGGTVTIRGQVKSDSIMVSVTDEGIGMTPEQQVHLFERFYRADASNTAIGGTGLGLAISKLIVELHGGRMWAESHYGVGSTFYFTLPLSDIPR